MAAMDWDTEQIEQVRWEMLNRRTRTSLQAVGRHSKPVRICLIIDDSLVEKSGKNIEGVDYCYSHSAGQTTWGPVWVTGHLVVLGQSYPVAWKLYRRCVMCEALGIAFAPKPELAAMILGAFQPLPGTQTYVLTDSWYPSQDLLDLCAECDFHLISAVKSDRKFSTADHNVQVKQWAQISPKRAFDLVTVNTACYKVWSATGRLSGDHRIKMVTHAFLELQRQEALLASTEPDAHVTLGDIKRQHQSLSRRAEIAHAFALAQHGFELESVYRRLAA